MFAGVLAHISAQVPSGMLTTMLIVINSNKYENSWPSVISNILYVKYYFFERSHKVFPQPHELQLKPEANMPVILPPHGSCVLTGDAPAIVITVLSAGGILAKIQYEQFIITAGEYYGDEKWHMDDIFVSGWKTTSIVARDENVVKMIFPSQ